MAQYLILEIIYVSTKDISSSQNCLSGFAYVLIVVQMFISTR